MTVDILLLSKILAALLTIGGVLYAMFKWVDKQNDVIGDLASLKSENAIICSALLACLDGLEQLGANHTVTNTKEALKEYINNKAHDKEN